eukprot:13755_1
MTDVENQELTALKQDLEQRGIQPSESTDNTLARTVQEQEIAGLQVQQAAQQPPPRPQTTQDTSFKATTTAFVQNTLDATDRKQFACFGIYILLVISSPAIAAVIIAAQYDKNTSACGADGETYLVDPDIYLYVAGGVQLGMFVIYSLSQMLALLCCGEELWLTVKETLMRNQILHCISLCYPLFHIAWACIGIYIYTEEMSDACQDEDVGVMMLSWIIIEFVLVFGLICCCGCLICWSFAGLAMTGSMNNVPRPN